MDNLQIDDNIATADKLRVELTEGGKVFGFGRRVVVPSDQIHVVSGAGRHSALLRNETQIFGAASGQPAVYWMNRLTQVVPLRTITFVVPVVGRRGQGVHVLDSDHVPYTVTAHVVAKLDEEHPETAARRVGHDISSLVNTIEEVTEAELIDAAAGMGLEDVIKNRQRLAEAAQERVNETLRDLGYNLVLLKVSELGGNAYQRLVEQATALVTRDSTISINTAELATHEDVKKRERREANVDAETRKESEAQRIAADERVATLELDKEEALAARRHNLDIASIERRKEAKKAEHSVNVAQVELDREVLAAELATEKELAQQSTKADAERMELEQQRQLERELARTQAEAERLAREAAAAADRKKTVKLRDAEAEGQAYQIKIDAETRAELTRAERDAEAAELKAEAEKLQAEATRAREAAPGLAQADVDERMVGIDAARVDVERDRGLAEAEVEAQQRQVEIDAQQQLAGLYRDSPVLVELEKIQRQYDHEQALAQIEADTRLAIIEALAPQMDINLHVIGDGSRVGSLMAQIMTVAYGADLITQEVPLAGQLTKRQMPVALGDLIPRLTPHLHTLEEQLQPRVFSTMRLTELVDHLLPVVQGEADLVSALASLRESSVFKLIADVPVGPLLEQFGMEQNGHHTPA